MFEHDPEVLAAFAEESGQRLDTLEKALLRLENEPANPPAELLNAAFRDAHSVKAGANLLNLRAVEVAAHTLENVLDCLRAGKISASAAVYQALLDGVDLLRERLASPTAPPVADSRLAALTALRTA